MRPYEKDLQKLLELSDRGRKPVHEKTAGMNRERMYVLSEQDLISLTKAGDNKLFITLTPAGIAYFDIRKEKKRAKIIDYCLKNWIAFLAMLISLAALYFSLFGQRQ